uniref:DUF7356 domain-containing protein n=1 Tax=Aegilops tauschii TaxID=37682 RepID=R7WDB6_AEGTA
MGSFRLAALTALLLAFALLPDPAAARVLQGKKPGSGEGAPVPDVATGGSEKSAASKEPGQPSTPVGNPETGVPESKGQKGAEAEVSAQPVPAKNGRNESPPPGSPESTGGGSGNKKPATESKEVAEECKDPVDTCSIEGLSACLQVSKTDNYFDTAVYGIYIYSTSTTSIGQFFIVENTGQKTVTVDVKATSDISIKQTLPPLKKGESKRVNINYSSPNGGEVTLNVGTEHCVLRIRQPVYDWQQQFQQLTSYATTVKPIYGAYFGVFTLVLVGAVFACCKFAGTKRDGGVPYQQLEMGSQAPDSSGANNTTSTGDGWEDGWDDDWDDEEAPAKPSEKGSAGSISANGLSMRSPTNRSPTNSKDGWDVDWDD